MDKIKTYTQIQNSALGDRTAEGEAFAKAASKLHQATVEPIDEIAFEDALQSNLKLWTVLQASLRDDDKRLPSDLRQDILQLSIFVDTQTLRARVAPSPGTVKTLIDINRNMAGGLFNIPKE